ncbi:hypothetical protein [Lysinibacillus sp. SGAir0095]|uniref:hypothetical protein n=1 Tax=Lysinibacillus sp. SGAir0095 TaxID=2070463 RepID=UPI0010CCC80F|nr:hypothetical protein [Lysinibacillus sp. SGAir0095]QCR31541.1 hypothetical protein C1N55_04870 [Lysinibacillus sp. SGAir0095]
MKGSNFRRVFAIFMIAFMLFWSALPSISMAFFITPGNAITPGEAITGGKPITGGQFIIPGQVITPGNPYQGGPFLQGGDAAVSGQPIIPPYQSSNGQWIIPNVAGSLPINNPIVTGGAMTGGEGPSGGQAVNGGNATQGGEGPTGGNAVNGGDGTSPGDSLTGGNPAQGGDGLTGGNPAQGGDGPTGGEGLTGGDPTQGGEGPTGGEGLTGGDPTQGGEGPTGGNNPTGGDPAQGGEGPSGGNSPEGNGTSGNLLDTMIPTADTTRGPLGVIAGALQDGNRFITSFGKNLVEGLTATYAGYKFTELASGNYRVVSNRTVQNPVLNYFYDSFKKYDLGGRQAYMPVGGANPRPHKIDSFFTSKNLSNWSTPSSFIKTTWSSLKTGLNESFNIFSKKFYAPSNMMKLNGPVNIIASAFNSVYDYGWGEKSSQGILSSNFAADLTVDLAVGAGTTALSSVLSSAVGGAVAGSAFPGVGTAVGAVVGLGVGLVSTYLINGTEPGRKAKQWVSDKLSRGYRKVAEGAKGLFNGAKKLFGFG